MCILMVETHKNLAQTHLMASWRQTCGGQSTSLSCVDGGLGRGG